MHRRHALWFIPSLGLIACLVAGGCGQNLSQSSAPYNQGSNAGADRFGRDVRPGEGIARDGSVVGGSTLVLGIKVTGADLDDTDMDYAGNPAAFVEWAGKKGFGAIGLYAVEPTEEADQVATFYFPDVEFASGKRLSEYGYAPGPDYLTPLVRAARGAGIGTQADLTRLAMSLPESSLVDRPFAGEPLSANEIEHFASYLLQTTELDSISARASARVGRRCPEGLRGRGPRFFAGDYDARSRRRGCRRLLDLGRGMAQNELALGVARRDPFMLWAASPLGAIRAGALAAARGSSRRSRRPCSTEPSSPRPRVSTSTCLPRCSRTWTLGSSRGQRVAASAAPGRCATS